MLKRVTNGQTDFQPRSNMAPNFIEVGGINNLLCKIRLFYYSQNLNFCLDLYLNDSHLLRYLGVRLLKLGFMDIDADRRN